MLYTLTADQMMDWLNQTNQPDGRNLVRARALQHFNSRGKVLAVGHYDELQSMYDNPQLYPQLFPWLFPYGMGGLGNARGYYEISEPLRKKQLLMYYDKRFQLDSAFALIAFNHEQIKHSVTGGYLLAKRQDMDKVAGRILNVDDAALTRLIDRLKQGHTKAADDAENDCFKIIKDLDYVSSHVPGSLTSRKQMRSEAWSMMSYLGAPSWFITFAPADINHQICLYYADTKQEIYPKFREYDDRVRLIANNPVAGARFFKMMVELFIEHVLGVGTNHHGVYGKTSGYYGTVEQQGRLTLHLHMLVWIRNSLTPQEIRTRIMDPNSDFQQRMVQYLESVRIGEFTTGTMEEISDHIDELQARIQITVHQLKHCLVYQ